MTFAGQKKCSVPSVEAYRLVHPGNPHRYRVPLGESMGDVEATFPISIGGEYRGTKKVQGANAVHKGTYSVQYGTL